MIYLLLTAIAMLGAVANALYQERKTRLNEEEQEDPVWERLGLSTAAYAAVRRERISQRKGA